MNEIIKIRSGKAADPSDHLGENVLMLAFNENYELVSANNTFLEETGFQVEDLKVMDFLKDICKHMPDYTEDEIKYLLNQKKPWQGNFILPSKEQNNKWFIVTIFPARNSREEFVGFNFIATHGKTQQDLIISQKSTESWMQAIFNDPEEGNILINKEGEVIDFNSKAYDFLQWYVQKELKNNEEISTYFHKDFSSTFQAIFEKAKNGQRQKFIRNFKNPSAYSKIINIEFRPVFSEAKEIMGIIMIIHDITSEVTLENRIRLSEKRLNEIAFINAHEVRAPLASILGLLNLLDLDHEALDEQTKTILSHLRTSANDLESVIRKVSESAYLEEGDS